MPVFEHSLDGGSRTFISGGAWAGSPFVALTARLRKDSGRRVTRYLLVTTSPAATRMVSRPFSAHCRPTPADTKTVPYGASRLSRS